MIKLPHEDWMLKAAQEKADELGAIKRSITKGKGNLAGYLAEIALSTYLLADNVSCEEGTEKHNYDLLKGDLKIEVKTKRRSVDPLPEYEVSIASTSVHQKPDVYAFVSITFAEKEGKGRATVYKGVETIWLCGFMPRDEYFERARYVPKGKMDFTNGFKAHQNMYNMLISDLYLTLQQD